MKIPLEKYLFIQQIFIECLLCVENAKICMWVDGE